MTDLWVVLVTKPDGEDPDQIRVTGTYGTEEKAFEVARKITARFGLVTLPRKVEGTK